MRAPLSRKPLGLMKRQVLLVLFTLFAGNAGAAPEDAFWRWFERNEARLFAFENNRAAVFRELYAELSRMNGDLTFEFGPVQTDGKRQFVISAGGIRSAFPSVESLFSKAPSLKRWVWVKFRPRRKPLNDIEFAGRRVRVEDVHYLLAKDEGKLGIVLFFDGYKEEPKHTFEQIGYLLLDEALGEYAVEMQVGFIEFQSRQSKYFAKANPLKELPDHFDQALGRSAAH